MQESIQILGLMSGSSLDGVDLAVCAYQLDGSPAGFRNWEMRAFDTVNYPDQVQKKLSDAGNLPIDQLMQLDVQLGKLYGTMISNFLLEHQQVVQAVAIHGHTARHEPAAGYSLQLGAGAEVATTVRLPVVTELRDADITAGGQGAPLAPLADDLLWPGYDAYVNIGGIANCYLVDAAQAYDTGAANQVLNFLARQLGRPYDAEGQIAAGGKILPALRDALAALPWFQKAPPKSLANQWIWEVVIPIVEQATGSIEDKLHTVTYHIAWHISEALQQSAGKTLVTGGGARNTFLLEMIRGQIPGTLEIPASNIIDYKEAALVALIGLFRILGRKAPIAGLTGAIHDTIPGALYLPAAN